MNRDVAFFSKIPKLLENYLFCTDEKMCRSIQSAFDLKIYAIKNMTFPSIIEELCKRLHAALQQLCGKKYEIILVDDEHAYKSQLSYSSTAYILTYILT